ncbi:MAG TPA: glycosyltransferase family 9 protein, partial [Opitutaceae bacterium]
ALALNVLGRLTAAAPEPLLRAACVAAGEAILWLAPRRRRVLRSNLHHAFPGRPRSWRRSVARESSRRLVETFLLSAAGPFLSKARMRRIATLGPSAEALVREIAERPRPVVLGTLHLALWETQTWLPALSPVPLPTFGIIYRPLDNRAADDAIKRDRERHGMRLLSRREGFAEAMALLRGNGVVGVLVDQNAGSRGALSLVLGRVCSSTELPGILAEKFGAEVRGFRARRTGFWRVTFECEALACDGTSAGATIALNQWYERSMEDDELCRSWLWAHDRWRNQDVPERRLRLQAKRNLLGDELRIRGLPALPRRTRFWVRLPNWLGDIVIALPLLRALRASRPDAEITLLAQGRYAPLLSGLGIADAVEPLPPAGASYLSRFAAMRARYPDTWILFTNSVRGDLEARASGCPQRFGVRRTGHPRPLLSHAYELPADFEEGRHHQLELWENFLRHFGLEGPLDLSPLRTAGGTPTGPIGLIAGSENSPEKRWPRAHWRALVEAFPAERFVLFGTAADAAITAEIAGGLGERVTDLAGKTDLAGFAERLAQCRLLVTNDTGGMHLANALGVAVLALFGPTNPVRTGPVFAAPYRILQPPGCPPTGGGRLQDLLPAAAIAAVRDLPWAKT